MYAKSHMEEAINQSSYVMRERQSWADHIGVYEDTCKSINSWCELGMPTTAICGCHSGNIMQQIPKAMIGITQECTESQSKY